jgi:hypothetical protein
MIAMLLLWTILSAIFAWVTIALDDLHYGRPRTFQMDAVVGHGDSPSNPSHFIALNLNRHIEIIEISGGDAAHTHIYNGPQLYRMNDDLVPVTVKFVDVNDDHKLDMIKVKWDKIYATCTPYTSLETCTMFSTTWASFPQLIHSSLHHFALKMVDNWVAELSLHQVHFL